MSRYAISEVGAASRVGSVADSQSAASQLFGTHGIQRSAKQIHSLSPAVLPVGLRTVMLAPGALATDVRSDGFSANSGRADHSRAPPALL